MLSWATEQWPLALLPSQLVSGEVRGLSFASHRRFLPKAAPLWLAWAPETLSLSCPWRDFPSVVASSAQQSAVLPDFKQRLCSCSELEDAMSFNPLSGGPGSSWLHLPTPIIPSE